MDGAAGDPGRSDRGDIGRGSRRRPRAGRILWLLVLVFASGYWLLLVAASVLAIREPEPQYAGTLFNTGIVLVLLGMFLVWAWRRELAQSPTLRIDAEGRALPGHDVDEPTEPRPHHGLSGELEPPTRW